MRVLWARWLVAAAVVVLAFGLSLVLAAELMQGVFESLYFTPRTGSELGADAAAYTAFLQGVLGAVMVGWATLLLVIVLGPFRHGEPSAWKMIAASLAVWFVVDTAFSLWTGYWQNSILNTALFAVFAIPLWATYRDFYPQATGA